MARRHREAPPAARRNEILDVAQRLVMAKGYQQMTIEDILAEMDVSKGAFYHYFDSKAGLLEALIERMVNEGCRVLNPILEDPQLPAVEKIQRWFDTAAQWKTTRKEFLLSLLQVWYHDDNAVVRQKLRRDSLAWIGPQLTRVIHQGMREGTFVTAFPDQVGQVLFSLLYDLGDSLAARVLTGRVDEQALAQAEAETAAYTDAVERTLGARRGTLTLMEPRLLREWFGPPVPTEERERVPTPADSVRASARERERIE
jgi:AcrR family transcriptional regulator